MEYSKKGGNKTVINIYRSTQNKTGEEKSETGPFGPNKEKIILTDIENSKSHENGGKYDFDGAMANDTKLSENSNSNNSEYRSYKYDANRTAKNEGGNVLNETGIVNNIVSSEGRTKDQDSYKIMNGSYWTANNTNTQIVKYDNDSKTSTDIYGKQDSIRIMNESDWITNNTKYNNDSKTSREIYGKQDFNEKANIHNDISDGVRNLNINKIIFL